MVQRLEEIAEYPMVRCEVHPGELRHGYIVCAHVLHGADIGLYGVATATSLGTIVCERCVRDERSLDHDRLARLMEALSVHCEECVRYHLAGDLGVFAAPCGVTVQ